MLLQNLKEMAIRAADLSAEADEWAKKLEAAVLKEPESHKVIGKIDDLIVRQKVMTVTIWDKDTMVAAAKVDKVPGVHAVIDDLWVKADRRGQRLITKFFLFLKSTGNKKLVLGTVHSSDTQNILKKNGFAGFKKYWTNIQGDEEEFDSSNLDKYYQKADWKLVLETSVNVSSFIVENSFTRSYEALAQILELNSTEALAEFLD